MAGVTRAIAMALALPYFSLLMMPGHTGNTIYTLSGGVTAGGGTTLKAVAVAAGVANAGRWTGAASRILLQNLMPLGSATPAPGATFDIPGACAAAAAYNVPSTVLYLALAIALQALKRANNPATRAAAMVEGAADRAEGMEELAGMAVAQAQAFLPRPSSIHGRAPLRRTHSYIIRAGRRPVPVGHADRQRRRPDPAAPGPEARLHAGPPGQQRRRPLPPLEEDDSRRGGRWLNCRRRVQEEERLQCYKNLHDDSKVRLQ
jgi:hypothetical protein